MLTQWVLGVGAPAGRIAKPKEPGPTGPGEGGAQMGRSSSLQGLGPPETTLPLHYQAISLAHFTGGEAHRLPHLLLRPCGSMWRRDMRTWGNLFFPVLKVQPLIRSHEFTLLCDMSVKTFILMWMQGCLLPNHKDNPDLTHFTVFSYFILPLHYIFEASVVLFTPPYIVEYLSYCIRAQYSVNQCKRICTHVNTCISYFYLYFWYCLLLLVVSPSRDSVLFGALGTTTPFQGVQPVTLLAAEHHNQRVPCVDEHCARYTRELSKTLRGPLKLKHIKGSSALPKPPFHLRFYTASDIFSTRNSETINWSDKRYWAVIGLSLWILMKAVMTRMRSEREPSIHLRHQNLRRVALFFCYKLSKWSVTRLETLNHPL